MKKRKIIPVSTMYYLPKHQLTGLPSIIAHSQNTVGHTHYEAYTQCLGLLSGLAWVLPCGNGREQVIMLA